jgi:hypothetical protein
LATSSTWKPASPAFKAAWVPPGSRAIVPPKAPWIPQLGSESTRPSVVRASQCMMPRSNVQTVLIPKPTFSCFPVNLSYQCVNMPSSPSPTQPVVEEQYNGSPNLLLTEIHDLKLTTTPAVEGQSSMPSCSPMEAVGDEQKVATPLPVELQTGMPSCSPIRTLLHESHSFINVFFLIHSSCFFSTSFSLFL